MAGPDMSLLTSAVDLSTVVIAVLAVFAGLVVAVVMQVGAAMVLRAVKGDDYMPQWESDVIDEANDMLLRGETPMFDRMMANQKIRHQRYF